MNILQYFVSVVFNNTFLIFKYNFQKDIFGEVANMIYVHIEKNQCVLLILSC